jgi:hypothetical protein
MPKVWEQDGFCCTSAYLRGDVKEAGAVEQCNSQHLYEPERGPIHGVDSF